MYHIMNTGNTEHLTSTSAQNTKLSYVTFKLKKINEKILKEAGGGEDRQYI